MSRYYFALHDIYPNGSIAISLDQAEEYNKKNYGIMHTVQSFNNQIRQAKNIKQLLAYALDLDDMTKKEQSKRIIDIGLEPSSIVETKRGFHIYFNIKGEHDVNTYSKFMSDYTIPLYNADKAAKDLARTLRVPNFYHCKDPDNKFLCKEVFSSKIKYTQKQFENSIIALFKKNSVKYGLIMPQEKIKLERFIVNTPRKRNLDAFQIANSIGNPIRVGNSYKVKCICHEEKQASLYFSSGNTVSVVWHCFAGCSSIDILNKLIELNLW